MPLIRFESYNRAHLVPVFKINWLGNCVMTKYLLKRILRGLFSVVVVVAIVMVLIYSLGDRERIFQGDGIFSKKANNDKEVYKYSQWEKYGYLDYVQYSDYLMALVKSGEITEQTREEAVAIPRNSISDSGVVAKYVKQFTEYYESQGYTVVRLDAKMQGNKLLGGGKQQLFAYKDTPVFNRMLSFFTNLIQIDNIHYVEDDIENRGLTFTLYDPVYNTEAGTGELKEEVFSPAIIGNGTRHKYLLYFTDEFPFVHQNLVTIRLGTSYAVNRGVDVFDTMVSPQGAYVKTTITYPTGLVEERADNLHTATYSTAGTKDSSPLYSDRFTDDYTNVEPFSQNRSRLAFSFVIGVISSILAYVVALPIGIMMARKKDKLLDKIGTLYIIFILACPSLAYIFMVQAIGRAAGLPHYFNLEQETPLMYLLPVISLAMPSIASLMKWLRRYMIDQMNSDYVKFARSGGLSEGEIFSKHIFKNAAIPIIHGIPGSVLGALVGAIITEKIYYVPGVGNMLTNAISLYDNSVIVGLTLFYALISIISIILGDMLMAMVDPRISFTSKAR